MMEMLRLIDRRATGRDGTWRTTLEEDRQTTMMVDAMVASYRAMRGSGVMVGST